MTWFDCKMIRKKVVGTISFSHPIVPVTFSMVHLLNALILPYAYGAYALKCNYLNQGTCDCPITTSLENKRFSGFFAKKGPLTKAAAQPAPSRQGRLRSPVGDQNFIQGARRGAYKNLWFSCQLLVNERQNSLLILNSWDEIGKCLVVGHRQKNISADKR